MARRAIGYAISSSPRDRPFDVRRDIIFELERAFALDHIRQRSSDRLRINADFAYPATINPTVHHSSDHDPVLVRIRPDGAAWLDGDLHYPGIGVELLDGADAPLATAVTDANGEFRVWNLTPGPVRVKLTAGYGVELAADDFVLELDAGRNVLPPQEIVHATIRAGVDAAVQTLTCLATGACTQ